MVKNLLNVFISLLVLLNLILPFSIWQKLNKQVDEQESGEKSRSESLQFDLESCQKELLEVINDCKP